MKLVSNAKDAWRWWSVRAMVVQGAVAGSWLAVPDDMRAAVPSEWLAAVAVALTVLGIAGRLIDQGGGDA
jgi:hypothetical protein